MLSLGDVDVTITDESGGSLPQTAVRQAVSNGLWPSVDGTYKSVFKFNDDQECPNTIVMKNNVAMNEANTISRVQASDISEDDNVCSGATFYSVSIPYLKSEEGRESAMGTFSDLDARLERNSAAASSLHKFRDSRIGFDGWANGTTLQVRTCGSRTYGDTTFWFSIRGRAGNKVSIGASGEVPTTTDFPAGTKGLFVSEYDCAWSVEMAVVNLHTCRISNSTSPFCACCYCLLHCTSSWLPAADSVYCEQK